MSTMDGKVALVTGGGTGIGLMIAEGFADNGAKVYVAGRRKAVLQTAVAAYKGKGSLVPLQMDVTDPASITDAVKLISEKEGKLDVLVNNAGIGSPHTNPKYREMKLERIANGDPGYDLETFEGFESIFRTNAHAPFFVATAFLDLLVKGAQSAPGGQGTASIINISSGVSQMKLPLATPSFGYALSKAALDLLTTQLAASFARYKIPIRVNTIVPGVFPTDIFSEGFVEMYSTRPLPGLIEPVPVRRFGRSEEIANMALLLATNGYVNGAFLTITGGVELVNP